MISAFYIKKKGHLLTTMKKSIFLEFMLRLNFYKKDSFTICNLQLQINCFMLEMITFSVYNMHLKFDFSFRVMHISRKGDIFYVCLQQIKCLIFYFKFNQFIRKPSIRKQINCTSVQWQRSMFSIQFMKECLRLCNNKVRFWCITVETNNMLYFPICLPNSTK